MSSLDSAKGATVLQYILFVFTITIVSTSTYMCFSTVASSVGKVSTTENKLCDVGGAVSADVMIMDIFLPSGGKITYDIPYIPLEVAGESVDLNISMTSGYIEVSSGEIFVRYTAMWCINGSINKTTIVVER